MLQLASNQNHFLSKYTPVKSIYYIKSGTFGGFSTRPLNDEATEVYNRIRSDDEKLVFDWSDFINIQ